MRFRRWACIMIGALTWSLSIQGYVAAQTVVSGTTVDASGANLPMVLVEAYCTNTNAWLGSATSMGNPATFSFSINYSGCSAGTFDLRFTHQGSSTVNHYIYSVLPSQQNPVNPLSAKVKVPALGPLKSNFPTINLIGDPMP